MPTQFRSGVVHRHLPALRSVVLDIAETLRHDIVDGKASIQQSSVLPLRKRNSELVTWGCAGQLTY